MCMYSTYRILHQLRQIELFLPLSIDSFIIDLMLHVGKTNKEKKQIRSPRRALRLSENNYMLKGIWHDRWYFISTSASQHLPATNVFEQVLVWILSSFFAKCSYIMWWSYVLLLFPAFTTVYYRSTPELQSNGTITHVVCDILYRFWRITTLILLHRAWSLFRINRGHWAWDNLCTRCSFCALTYLDCYNCTQTTFDVFDLTEHIL